MTGWIVPRAELISTHEEQMLGLMQAHFCGISPQQFRHDLDEKNWAILITDEAGRLHGFSMLLFYATAFEGRQLNVVYSGRHDRRCWCPYLSCPGQDLDQGSQPAP